MKEYRYDSKTFFMQVKVTSWVCIAVIAVTLYFSVIGKFQPLMVFLSVIAFYTIWNTYVSRSTVEVVRMSDQEIQFETFGKTVTYPIEELTNFKIREFPTSGKMYLRINKHSLTKGRYWLQTAQFNDGKELFNQLINLEYKLYPETLKSRARTVNTKYIQAKRKKQS